SDVRQRACLWRSGRRNPGVARSPVVSRRHQRVCGQLTDIESTPLTATMEASRPHGSQQGAALMKQTTKYVGLDVHQATTVAVVGDDTGRVIARSVVPTEASALRELVPGMRW